jgi:hypothetical protein
MSIPTWAKEIWHQSPRPPPSRCFHQIWRQKNKMCPTNRGEHFHYALAHDMMVLKDLNSIAVEQTKATEQTTAQCTQLLDYLSHNADAKICFHASNMVLNIHSDASYLLEPKAQSHACGHFFMGWMPTDWEPIHLNVQFVVASTVEAKLSALYHNCQPGIIFRLTLKEMGHKQPKTPVHCNNATAVGIANSSIKRQRLRLIEM